MLTRTTAHHATSDPPQWPRSGEIEAKSGGSGSRSKKFRRDFQAPTVVTGISVAIDIAAIASGFRNLFKAVAAAAIAAILSVIMVKPFSFPIGPVLR